MVKRIGLLSALVLAFATDLDAQEEDYYRIVTLPVPETVPFEVSGLERLPDGRIAAAIRRGEVWLVEGAYKDPPDGLRFRRIAQALHEPLGLIHHGDSLYLAQRSELTRLRDLDGDDVIDEYLTVTGDWGLTGHYHEYAYGPRVDGQGDFWITLNAAIGNLTADADAWRGWAVKVTPQGRLVPVATGLRSPCGIGMNAGGEVFTTDQQGGWVATGALHHVEEGDFYGHPDGLKSCSLPGSPVACPERIPTGITVVEAASQIPGFKLPAVWFPYRKMGRSATGPGVGPFGRPLRALPGTALRGGFHRRHDLAGIPGTGGRTVPGRLLPLPGRIPERRCPPGLRSRRIAVRGRDQPRLEFPGHPFLRPGTPGLDRPHPLRDQGDASPARWLSAHLHPARRPGPGGPARFLPHGQLYVPLPPRLRQSGSRDPGIGPDRGSRGRRWTIGGPDRRGSPAGLRPRAPLAGNRLPRGRRIAPHTRVLHVEPDSGGRTRLGATCPELDLEHTGRSLPHTRVVPTRETRTRAPERA